MTQAAKAQEPSMEEILASIRRIIADDDVSKPAKTPEQERPRPLRLPHRRPAFSPAASGLVKARRSSDAIASKAHSASGRCRQ